MAVIIEAGQDFQSVAALVIFCLAVAAVLLLVLWPLHLAVPCVYVGQRCGGLWPITFVLPWQRHKQPKLADSSGGGHAAAASLAPEPLWLPLPYCWAPVAGIALMLLCQSMSWADVWRGLVGDDRIMPYGIMVGACASSCALHPLHAKPYPVFPCNHLRTVSYPLYAWLCTTFHLLSVASRSLILSPHSPMPAGMSCLI